MINYLQLGLFKLMGVPNIKQTTGILHFINTYRHNNEIGGSYNNSTKLRRIGKLDDTIII